MNHYTILLLVVIAALQLISIIRGEKRMSALTDLEAAVTAQTAGVAAAVTAIDNLKTASGTPDSVLEPLAQTIAQNNATLAAALPTGS